MAAGSTYTPIATTTLSSTASTIVFSSISSSYTDLIAIVNGTAYNSNTPTGSSTYGFTFNGDTGTNYSATGLYGNGSSAASYRTSNTSFVQMGQIHTSTISTSIFHFQNYSNSTTYKTIVGRNNMASTLTGAWVGLWRSTSSINSITFGYFDGSGYFNSGTSITLYGITAA